jgi:hypothetical protein
MRPPFSAIEPFSFGVSMATRGDCASAASRVRPAEGAPGAVGTAVGAPVPGAVAGACGAPGAADPGWGTVGGVVCWASRSCFCLSASGMA